MAATVLSATYNKVGLGILLATVVIPTTVDGTDGGYAIVSMGRMHSLTLQYESTNWNAKTLTLTGGNDGVNFYALSTAISVTANGAQGLAVRDDGFKYYKVSLSGAPTAALTVILCSILFGR